MTSPEVPSERAPGSTTSARRLRSGPLRRSFAAKLTLGVLLASALVLGVIFTANYLFSRQLLLRLVGSYAQSLVAGCEYRIDSVIRTVEAVPKAVASGLERDWIDVADLNEVLPAMIASNPEVFGSTVAFEPGIYQGREHYAPYFFVRDGAIVEKSLASEAYDYRSQEWYTRTLAEGKPIWTEPYFDEGGGEVLMTTYAVPMTGAGGVEAVVTADVALDWLQELAASISLGERGYVFLVSRAGQILSHPDPRLIMAADARGGIDEATDGYFEQLDGAWADASREPQLLAHDPYVGGAGVLLRRDAPRAGWSIGLVFSETEMTGELRELSLLVWGLGTLGALLLVAILAWFSHRMVSPLKALAAGTARLGQGELDVDLPAIRGDDEIGVLSRAFVRMRDDLRSYIRRLTETVAAREKLEHELEIAQTIQLSMVPREFAPRDASSEVDVFATLIPARGVGGDLFDTFDLDPERVFFALGDVSGKGVPAALMMARTVTLIRGLARLNDDPAEILSAANVELARDNDSCMFVTLVCGVLHRHTGALILANAGHTEPLWLRASGEAEYFEPESALGLGLYEEAEFANEELQLGPGDRILFYSDGVTEARDPDGQLYGEERLLTLAGSLESESAQQTVTELARAIERYAGGAEPADDIAVLAFGWHPGPVRRLEIENDLAEHARVQAVLRELCESCGVPESARRDLRLILEELLTNVIRHAYPPGRTGSIEVLLARDEASFRIEVCDQGVPFDPLGRELSDGPVELAERHAGGMGLLLIRELASGLAYECAQGRNRLRVEYALA